MRATPMYAAMSARSVSLRPCKKFIAGTLLVIAARMIEGLFAAFSGPPEGGEPWHDLQIWL